MTLDHQTTVQSTLPAMDTINNDLCDLCLQALTINDQFAGGTIYENTDDGTTGLDLCGFALNHWKVVKDSPLDRIEVREGRFSINSCLRDYTKGIEWTEMFCAGNHHERLVTPPGMLELSLLSAAGTCRLCSRLKVIFIEEYGELYWWNEHGSVLHFTIQYEWGHQGLQAGRESKGARLDGLAVSVIRPGHKTNEADVYHFDVVAWPGTYPETTALYSYNVN